MKTKLLTGLALLTLISPTLVLAPALASEPVLMQAELKLPENAVQLPEISFAASPATASQQTDSFQPQTTIFGLPLNMGPIDRSLRGVLALGLIGTGIYGLASGQINTPLAASLIGIGLIPTATAASGYCPLYQLFGLKYSF